MQSITVAAYQNQCLTATVYTFVPYVDSSHVAPIEVSCTTDFEVGSIGTECTLIIVWAGR